MNRGKYLLTSKGSFASGDFVILIATFVDVNSVSCGVSSYASIYPPENAASILALLAS